MSKTFTDLYVRNLKPDPGGRIEIPDGGQRGLYLVVQASGTKSWAIRYRHPRTRKPMKMTLQSGLTLAQARKIAADHMFQLAQGIDPTEAKKAKKQAALNATEGTLNAVVSRYLDLAASKLRSRAIYEATLKNHILPKLGEYQIATLKRTEITAVLDHVEQNSGPSAADAAKRVLSAVMNWHQSRSEFVSPMTRMRSRLKPSERARTHVPSDDEIKQIWVAAGDERIGLYGQTVRLMILCGARKSEAAKMRRSEIEVVRDNGDQFTIWRLPRSRSKNKREIVRPVSRAALDIIENAPMISDCEYVFTLNGRSPMNMNYQDKKHLLDEIAEVKGWRLHDSRRIFRSLCSRCRVPYEISERLLGHSQSLLTKTYDQHSHLPAMQDAVEKVAAEIERIVTGDSGKVIRPAFAAR